MNLVLQAQPSMPRGVIGLFLLTSAFIFSLFGCVDSRQSERFGVIALYWHFVDAVWIVVFTVVYLIGR